MWKNYPSQLKEPNHQHMSFFLNVRGMKKRIPLKIGILSCFVELKSVLFNLLCLFVVVVVVLFLFLFCFFKREKESDCLSPAHSCSLF